MQPYPRLPLRYFSDLSVPASSGPSGGPKGIQIKRPKPGEKRQKRELDEEDGEVPEIFSLGGLFCVLGSVGICYGIYLVDQRKSVGSHNLLANAMGTSPFFKQKPVEHYIDAQKENPLTLPPDNWNIGRVVVNHISNIPSFSNDEGLVSKLYRYISLPNSQLLPPTREGSFKYTLVVDLNTICYTEWSREKAATAQSGHIRTLRPHWQEFIEELAMRDRVEVVVWGEDEQFDWEQDVMILDPKGIVQSTGGLLWGKDCYYFNRQRCKDISRLGRPLNKVIVLDSKPARCQLQPRNAIIIPPWSKGSDGDEDEWLPRVKQILSYISAGGDIKQPSFDVREVLDKYRGKDMFEEFEKEYLASIQSEQAQSSLASPRRSGFMSMFTSGPRDRWAD